jgi:V8-like Glu-specific endopeptidase
MTSENKHHDDNPAHAGHGSRFRRVAVVAGLAVTAALVCAATVPALAGAATTPHVSTVSGHATANAGGASPAAKRAAAYWTRSRMLSARNASTITTGSTPNAHAAPIHASGPAGHVAGTAPNESLPGAARQIAKPARVGVKPMAGSIGSPWPGNFYLPPATTTGKVFFSTHDGSNWVCSASTVNSNGKDTVITAGHCVYGSLGGEVPGEGWHTNWIFVPDYSNGYAPYGVWTARQLWTLTNYVYYQDEGDDIGAAVINTNYWGQHIVNVVGGQGFAWNWPASEYVYDFGYPQAPPFNGQTLQYCNGSEFSWYGISSTMGLPCNFTGGSSGGPWLMYFGGEFGYINGVNDFGYSSLPGYIFSAYFGNNAAALYNVTANL